MKRYLNNASVKLQLFYPVFIGFLIALVFATVFLVNQSRDYIFDVARESLQLEVETIKKMFLRERELKLEKVSTDLRFAHELFYEKPISFDKKLIAIDAVNQISRKSHPVRIPVLKHSGAPLFNSTTFTDKTFELFGITTTIFQKIDSGYLRISTNVLKADGERAVGTFIPNNSPVVKTVENGETYYGRAFVVNDWYITAYEPVYFEDEIVGMLYVGDKEKDLEKLNEVIRSLTSRKNWFYYCFQRGKTAHHQW